MAPFRNAIQDQAERAASPQLDCRNSQHGDKGKQLFERDGIDGQDLGAVLDDFLNAFLAHKEIIEDALAFLGDLGMTENPWVFQESVVAARARNSSTEIKPSGVRARFSMLFVIGGMRYRTVCAISSSPNPNASPMFENMCALCALAII